MENVDQSHETNGTKRDQDFTEPELVAIAVELVGLALKKSNGELRVTVNDGGCFVFNGRHELTGSLMDSFLAFVGADDVEEVAREAANA